MKHNQNPTKEELEAIAAKNGGSLYLNNTQITSLPDNLTVGCYLDLRDTQITSLPDNLTVGGWLYLGNTPITSLPDNLTVGCSLDIRGTQIINKNNYKQLNHGDYVPGKYLYADGILTHIKRKKTIGQYTYYIGKIEGKNVVQKGNIYAHCKTFRDGVKDIEFKAAESRGAEQYKNLTLDSTVTKDEAITMYRIITGACRQGTEMFVRNLKETKSTYTVREIIDITKGQYNSSVFKAFFAERED